MTDRQPLSSTTQGLQQRWSEWAQRLIGAAFASALVLHADLGTYSRYIADDYCSAAMANRFGIFRAVWYWYLNWTGRYSASALDATFGLIGPGATPVVTVFALLIWLAVLTLAFAVFSSGPRRQQVGRSLILALTVLYVTLVLSPNVSQSLYWGQGMRSIVPPLILGAVYSVLLSWFSARAWPRAQTALWLAAACLLTFLIGGFNETFTALELSTLGLVLVISLASRSRGTHSGVSAFLAAGALGAGLAFLVVVIAPGNAFRQAYFPPPPGLVRMLSIAWANFWAFLPGTFGSLVRLLAILGALVLSIFLGPRIRSERPSIWLAPIVLAVGLALAFLCFLPAAYGLSEAPPDRTLMIPAHLLAIALIMAGLIIGGHLALKIAGMPRRTFVEAGILLIAVVLTLGSVALSDADLLAIRPAYVEYASAWDLMNAQILQARAAQQSQIQIPTKVNWAGLDEPNDNPKFWVNVCYRQYYGLEVLAESPP